ncbi:MAG: 5-guanidino-2-oxopentanoate decarboxylase [Rhodobacteraceae bacterium]|nr:5-guanidino-2-oxopentanoate decarboxylase [Paracoccaceae bacterium]
MLRQQGVECVFGIPGVHNQELYRGLGDDGPVHILARHEQGACFMADGYARATGKPGVAFLITGPGLTNGLTAIGQAYSDSVPMLVVASCLNPEQRGPGTGYLHKLKDQDAAGDSVADWSLTAESAEEAFDLLDRAFEEFTNSRPRPKIINIPLHVLASSGAPRLPRIAPPALPRADAPAIDDCAERLNRARYPLFIFGGGAVAATVEAREVVRMENAASFMTYAGRGIIPPGDPLGFGSYLARPESHAIIASADLVIAVGTELSQVDLWRDRLGHSAPMIRVDIDAEVLAHSEPDDLPILSDARHFLSALAHRRKTAKETDWSAFEIAAIRNALRASCDSERPGIAAVAEALWSAIPDSGVVFSDMTQFAYVAKEVVRPAGPGGWHHPYGYGTLGYALPAAIGAKAGEPDRDVVAIAGDYGFQYTMQELGTAAELAVPLPIILWDNQALQEIADSMVQAQIEPCSVRIMNPDFAALAAAYGLPAAEAVTIDGLCEAVRAALTADRPTIIRADAGRLTGAVGNSENIVD